MAEAFIVVDVQNGFCEGGELAVRGGSAVATKITNYLAAYSPDVLVTTQDWHKPNDDNDGHFTRWPVHCVANTFSAMLHPNLQLPRKPDFQVRKGIGVDGYSGFDEDHVEILDSQMEQLSSTTLAKELKTLDVTKLVLAGIAFDFCVAATAKAGVDNGFKVTIVKDLCATIDLNNEPKIVSDLLAAKIQII